jgi:VCBS repeat-containing protein
MDSETFTITVSDINVAPVITSANVANVAENTTAVLTVTATDADLPAQTLSYSISGGADSGRFAINASTGALTFTAAPDYETPTDTDTNNVYVVQVTASDGAGRTTSQTINVTVTPVNEAPVGNDDSATTYQDAPISFDVVYNDTDPEGDTLVVSAVTQGANGTVTFAGGSVTYMPNAYFSGSDSFTYTMSDGNGGTSTATINVTVTPVDTPTSLRTEPEDQTLSEDTDGTGFTQGLGAINDQSLQNGAANAVATNIFGKGDTTLSHGSTGSSFGLSNVGMDRNDPGDGPFGRTKDNPIEEAIKASGTDGSIRNLNQRGPLEALRNELNQVIDRIVDPFWREPQRYSSDAEAMISNESIQRELDGLKQQLEESARPDELKEKLMVGMASGIGGTFFVGYVIWALRGASLLASALASLPLWRCFDPLTVLPAPKRRRRKHDTEGEDIEKARENEENVEELFSSVQGPRVRSDVKGTGK